MREQRCEDTFWERIDRYPPILIRLLARRGIGYKGPCRPLSDAEIATEGGLSLWLVRHISSKTDWSNVTYRCIRGFLRGCRVDIGSDRYRIFNYIVYQIKFAQAGKPGWAFLRHSERWESYYKLLLKRWLQSDSFAEYWAPKAAALSKKSWSTTP